MRKLYVWKVLTGAGLLKDHYTVDYNSVSFNDEYKTEEDAVEAYRKFKEDYEYEVESEMVLLTVYRTY